MGYFLFFIGKLIYLYKKNIMTEISIIVAIDKNNGIGKNGDMLYHISDDLKHFKELTINNAIIMGRKTFESIGSKPLPQRDNIVITSQSNLPHIDNVIYFDNIGSALEYSWKKGYDKVFFIGGASIYKSVLDLKWATKMYITYIEDNSKEADTFFPSFNEKEWSISSDIEKCTNDGIKYHFKEYNKKY